MKTARRPGDASGPLRVRLAWFVGLWAAGVGVVALVAYAIRLAIL